MQNKDTKSEYRQFDDETWSVEEYYFCESNESKKIKHILKIRPMFFCINNNSAANIQVYDMLKAYYT